MNNQSTSHLFMIEPESFYSNEQTSYTNHYQNEVTDETPEDIAEKALTEFHNLKNKIEEKGMKYTGRDKSGRRMEILELENHPYFMASQFHPEFKSRPDNPSPLHLGLVRAALEHKKIN